MHRHLFARYKSQTLATVPLFEHTKILHALVKMGSAALAAAVEEGRDNLVVRALGSRSKGHGFESRQELRENFLLQGQILVMTLISVSVPLSCFHSST